MSARVAAWDDVRNRSGGSEGDRRLRDIVAEATGIRLTDRLRLEPLGHEHLDDLVALHNDPGVAAWFDGPWSEADGLRRIAKASDAWESVGADRWMAYERSTGARVGRGGVALTYVDGADRFEVEWVVAFTEPHNERSRAVMSRLEMRFSREIHHAGRLMVLYVRRP